MGLGFEIGFGFVGLICEFAGVLGLDLFLFFGLLFYLGWGDWFGFGVGFC